MRGTRGVREMEESGTAEGQFGDERGRREGEEREKRGRREFSKKHYRFDTDGDEGRIHLINKNLR